MVEAATAMRLISCLLLGIGLLVVYHVNPGRTVRYRLVLMPVLAIAALGRGLLRLRRWTMHTRAYMSFFLRIAPRYASFIANGPIFDLVFLLNVAALKLLYNLLADWFEKYLIKLFRPQIEAFYAYDEETEQWFLRKDAVGLRKLSLFVAVAACVVSLVGSALFAGLNNVHLCFLPLVLLEFATFLGGRTKEEYESELTYEAGTARMVFGYANLERALAHYFGERLIVSSSRSKKHVSTMGNADLCAQFIASSDPRERICGAYFQALLDKGLIGKGGDNAGLYDDLVHDRVLDTVRLMKGQSVLFASTFYGDYVPYIFLPVNTTLLHGQHVVVLVGSEGAKRKMPEFVDEGISFVTNVPNMWNVGELSRDGSATPDVALMSFGDLDDISLLISNEAYFAQVGMCIVIEPSTLLATYQIGLSMLAERLAAESTPTYCVFDRNSDGLVDSLSHALRVHLVEVGATDYSEGTSFGLFWEVDGPQLQNRLMPGVARYLGVGTELELVALHEQVKKVTWAGREAVPLLDIRWIVAQYYAEMFDYADLPQEQAEVDERMEYFEEPSSMPRARSRFVVVEDEHNNMFEAYRQFSTRGIENSFVNVLAPNYLMRAYMADNARLFAGDPKAVPSIAPDVPKTARNAVYALVMEMLQTGEKMSEDVVAARLRYAGVQVRDAYEALAGLMVEHFPTTRAGIGAESHLLSEDREVYDQVSGHMVTKSYLGLSATPQAMRAFRGLRNVPLITEMPDGTRTVVGTRIFDLVYQSWLPGQFQTMDGKYYEVVSISEEGGILLRRAADHFSTRRYYRQLRSYRLEVMHEMEPLDARATYADVLVSRECASVDVRTYGYLDMDDFGDVAHARLAAMTSVPKRHHENKNVLRIELGEADAVVTRTLAVVLSELFVTLFPDDYQYLAVLTTAAKGMPAGVLYEFENEDEPTNIIWVVEDSSIDIGLVSAVERSIRRILETCFELLDWHEEKLDELQYTGGSIEVGDVPASAEDIDLGPREEPSRGIFGRLRDWLRDLLDRHAKGKDKDKGKGDGGATGGSQGGATEEPGDTTQDGPSEPTDTQAPEASDGDEPTHVVGALEGHEDAPTSEDDAQLSPVETVDVAPLSDAQWALPEGDTIADEGAEQPTNEGILEEDDPEQDVDEEDAPEKDDAPGASIVAVGPGETDITDEHEETGGINTFTEWPFGKDEGGE